MKIFKKYNWLIEIISAALLLGMGLVVLFVDSIVLYVTGAVFVFLGIFRVIPLLKTTNDKLMKCLFLAEVLIGIGAGSYLFYMGLQGEEVGVIYGYIVGGVLYLRGLTHFVSTSLRGEPNNVLNFFAHIAFLSLGVFMISYGKIDSTLMKWIIAVIVFICVIFLGIKGSKDYGNYRGDLISQAETKKIKKTKEEVQNEIAPTSEEISININNIDEEKTENIINA